VQTHIKKNSDVHVHTDQSNQTISIKYEIMCCRSSIPYYCVHASYLKRSIKNLVVKSIQNGVLQYTCNLLWKYQIARIFTW
jgi:hypothetical protein